MSCSSARSRASNSALISLRSDSSAAAASSPASFALSGFFASIILQGRAADRVSFWASRGTRARLDAAAGAQLRAGLVPRRELGRRRGDGSTRQVTDLDLRGDLGLRTRGSGGSGALASLVCACGEEGLGCWANLDHREDRIVKRLRDPGKGRTRDEQGVVTLSRRWMQWASYLTRPSGIMEISFICSLSFGQGEHNGAGGESGVARGALAHGRCSPAFSEIALCENKGGPGQWRGGRRGEQPWQFA